MLLSWQLAFSILVLFLSIFHNNVAQNADPGIKFRLTDKGISYALAVGEKALNYKLNNSKLPGIRVQIDAGPGKGQMEIRKLQTEGFRAPSYHYQFLPPSGIKWTATDGSLTMKGAWSAWYKYLFKVSVNGYFIATAKNLTLAAVLDLSRGSDGRLQIKVPYCKSSVQSMRVKIIGGTVPKTINLFRGAIEDAMEEAIKRQVCKQVQTVLVQQANKKIGQLPTSIKIVGPFFMDYKLTSDPTFKEPNIEAAINGSITFGGEPSQISVPKMPEDVDSSKMMYLWISDYVVQSLITSAQNHGLLKIEISRTSMPNFTKGLRTTCPNSMCIGTLSDALAERYPDTYVVFDLWTDHAPSFTFDPAQSEFSARASGKMYVEPKSNDTLALEFYVDFKAHVTPLFKRKRLCAKVDVENLAMNVTKSNIGEITPFEIYLVMQSVQARLQERLNEVLGAGVPIPVYENVELLEPKITVLDRAIQIDTDYEHVGQEEPPTWDENPGK